MSHNTPLPVIALLAITVQLTSVFVLLTPVQEMPPPNFSGVLVPSALPAVTVTPSSTLWFTPFAETTW